MDEDARAPQAVPPPRRRELLDPLYPLFAGRWPARIGLLALAAFALFLALRIGRYPASSIGDDIWYDDSAYWLLHEGALRRHIHANVFGDATRDFLPPIAALATAASFRLFGVTQFAVGFAPTLASAIGVAGLASAFRRRFRIALLPALTLAILPFFAPDFLKMAVVNRFEAYVFAAIGLGIAFGTVAPDARLRPARVAPLLAGLCAGGAVIAHYPVAPITWSLVALWTCWGAHARARSALFCAGTALAGFAALAWIGADWPLFLHQMRDSSARYHHALTELPLWTAAYFALALQICAMTWRHRQARAFALLALLAVASMGWWVSGGFYGAIADTLALALFLHAPGADPSARPQLLARGLVMGMLGLVLVTAGTMTVLTLSQASARDYAAFQRNLRAVLPSNRGGLVLIDRAPYLALRPCFGAEQLHHMVMSDAATLPSRVLLDAGAVDRVQAVIVTPHLAADHGPYLPLYRAFLARPTRRIAVSALGIGPGVAHEGPYDVIVLLPADDVGPRLAGQCP